MLVDREREHAALRVLIVEILWLCRSGLPIDNCTTRIYPKDINDLSLQPTIEILIYEHKKLQQIFNIRQKTIYELLQQGLPIWNLMPDYNNELFNKKQVISLEYIRWLNLELVNANTELERRRDEACTLKQEISIWCKKCCMENDSDYSDSISLSLESLQKLKNSQVAISQRHSAMEQQLINCTNQIRHFETVLEKVVRVEISDMDISKLIDYKSFLKVLKEEWATKMKSTIDDVKIYLKS